MSPVARPLCDADRASLDAFLDTDGDATLFLRSNLVYAGIGHDGSRCSADYAGVFEDDALIAVASHAWNGAILLYAPEHAGVAARAVVASSKRAVHGILGVHAHVRAAQAALGLAGRAVHLDSFQPRYALELDSLIVPTPLQDGRWRVRVAEEGDVDELGTWRAAYEVETLGVPPRDGAAAEARARIGQLLGDRAIWVLLDGGRRVAMSAFNARVPDTVQIGGVFTPPPLRSRGYGRAVVAGSLLGVQPEGVRRSVLFTEDGNVAAQRAYEALGYRRVGDYHILFFEEPATPDLRPPPGA